MVSLANRASAVLALATPEALIATYEEPGD